MFYDFAAEAFFPGLLGVSAVGEEIDPAADNKCPTVIAGETCDI